MKKTLSLILILMLTAAMLTACGTSGGRPEAPDIASFRTIGDIIAATDAEYVQAASAGETFVYVFTVNDVLFRATAEMSQDISDEYYALDFGNADYEDQWRTLVSPLEIKMMEDLSAQKLTEKELKALAGKKGAALLDDGWKVTGYDLESMQFWMDYGPYEYSVLFDGTVDSEEGLFDEAEALRDLTVKSVTCSGIGDASGLD